jgi:hypothetical protein
VVPLLLSGCGVFKNQYQKNSKGFYERHYYACGPIALEKAINEFYKREGVVFAKNPAPRKEISQQIQKRGMKLKGLLTFFDPEAIAITWTSEIRYIIEKYGFELVKLNDIEKLDATVDIAIVLVHGEYFTKQYHWLVFPVDDIKNYYGDKTIIDLVYLLKWKNS